MNVLNGLIDVLKCVQTRTDHTLASAIVAIVFKMMDILAMVNSYNS